ncbi:MAG TPA: hypothetical protein VK204_19580 [Nocardioidaceae bacterium]|nr:hypothetical protein [Nocardioidaceae bacterium]
MGRGVRRVGSWAAVMLAATGATFLINDDSDGTPTPPYEAPHPDNECATAYTLDGPRQKDTFTWVMDVSSVPSYLDRAQVVRAVDRATRTVAEATSSCPGSNGGARLPRVLFAGPTEHQANVTPASDCFPPDNTDGINVVSFGRLPADVVAVTCTYTYRGDIWQTDVMLNDGQGVFTTTPDDPACVDSFDLQSVMTHERGHSFGLGHVPVGPATGALTMSSMMARCDASARTLGAGDVAGLMQIYPPSDLSPIVPATRDRRP